MAYTLTTMTDEVEALLSDTGNTYVSTGVIEDAIRWAMTRYDNVDPQVAVGTIDDVDDQVEYDIPSEWSGFLYALHVWWPYDTSEDVPALTEASWFMIDDDTIRLRGVEPEGDYQLRVQYAARHTLNGLDSATSTTLDERAEQLVITGAGGRALLSNVRAEIDAVNVGDSEVAEWRRWAEGRLDEFAAGLNEVRREKARRGVSGDARVSWG